MAGNEAMGGGVLAPHQRLARMAGTWEGVCRLWFERDMLAAETTQRGTLRPVLGGRFLQHDYVWAFDGRNCAGVALFGFHVDGRRWESTWADSFHTGSAMMYSVSAPQESPERIELIGSYPEGGATHGPHWGWRTRLEQVDDDRLQITMGRLSPDGDETTVVEVAYVRVRGA